MFNLQYWTLHLVTKGFRLLDCSFFLKTSWGLHWEPPSLFLMQHWRQIYNYIKCLFSMCVYIVQYYAINLMFNSDGVAAFPCQGAKERLLLAPAQPLPLSCLRQKEVLQGRAWTWDQPSVVPSMHMWLGTYIAHIYLFRWMDHMWSLHISSYIPCNVLSWFGKTGVC